MKPSTERRLEVPGLAALVFVAVAAHTPLRRATLDLLNADYATLWIAADQMMHGKWSAFPADMHYAGFVLTWARVFLLKLFSLIGWDWERLLQIHIAFTHALVPALMALTAFWTTRRVVSFWPAWWTGLLVAIGTRYLAATLQNDVYTMNFLFSLWVIGYRSTRRFPLLELDGKRLAALGVVSGLMLYNSRMMLIPLVVLWAPPVEDWKKWFFYLKPRDRVARAVAGAAIALAGLYVYLDFFGSVLGYVDGKRIKLTAPPNAKLAAVLALVIVVRNGIFARLRPYAGRMLIVAAGAVVGFLPEILHILAFGGVPPRGTEHWRPLPEGIAVLGKAPAMAAEIIADETNVFSLFSRVLWFSGVIGMVATTRRDLRFRPAVLLLGLGLLAFCMVENYAGANARYLLPIVPALVFGAAWGFEKVCRSRVALAAAAVALALHAGSLYRERTLIADKAIAGGHWRENLEIGRKFREAGVRVVGCDRYWYSNALSFASEMNPVFIELQGFGLHEPDALALWKTESVVGVLLSDPATVVDGKFFWGRKLKLRGLLARVGTNSLYLADLARD